MFYKGKLRSLRDIGKAPVRTRVALISLLVGALGACAVDTSRPPRLGYAPPSMPPAAPGLASAGQPADLIWNQLLDRLVQSSLQVDLADPERGIIVATYSGDPEPYVTCGWILVDRGGELEQVPASGEASFKRVVQGRRLEVTRDLKLDARLVVDVMPDRGGAAVETTSNYVLTKTLAAEPGWPQDSAAEVISFSAGERGQFRKGTVCQATGALERTVLDVLPRVAQAQRVSGDRRAPASSSAAVAPAAAGTETADRRAPAAGPDKADTGGQAATTQPPASGGSVPAPLTTVAQAELAEPEPPSEPEAPDQALAFECPIGDQVFCEVLDLTDPYRRANQERNLGLALETLESDNLLLSGSGLGFDVSLPNYDAYLIVSYFLNDGTVRHVLSGSYRRWPAHAREFVTDAGFSLDDRQSVEMVVALASDVPVFPQPRPSSESAALYLDELRERLTELTTGEAPAQIAASLVVVTPA